MAHLITRHIPVELAERVSDLIHARCRSVVCLHGDTDSAPVQFLANASEMKHVRRAIRIAKREAEAREIEKRVDEQLRLKNAAEDA